MSEPRWRFVRWKENIYIQIAPSQKLLGYPSELRLIDKDTSNIIEMLYDIHEIPNDVDPTVPTEKIPVYEWDSTE